MSLVRSGMEHVVPDNLFIGSRGHAKCMRGGGVATRTQRGVSMSYKRSRDYSCCLLVVWKWENLYQLEQFVFDTGFKNKTYAVESRVQPYRTICVANVIQDAALALHGCSSREVFYF